MPAPRRLLLAAILALAAFPTAAEPRFGVAAGQALEAEGEWVRIRSLPSVQPPYEGWVEGALVRICSTSREARLAYFAAHPLRERVELLAARISDGFWDLRDQGADNQTETGLWLRYGFDFGDWWVARGRSYYAEIREIADIQSADETTMVLLLFVAAESTPPEPLEIQILSDSQIRIRQGGGAAHRFGRVRLP